jgi:hypothetical protein
MIISLITVFLRVAIGIKRLHKRCSDLIMKGGAEDSTPPFMMLYA